MNFGRTIRTGQASPLIVAIGGHHHHRQLGPPRLDLAQQLQSVHDRHVDVRQDHDRRRLDALGKLVECFLTRIGEMQDVGAPACLAAKVLTEQLGHIGLVIDNQDADDHAKSPQEIASRSLSSGRAKARTRGLAMTSAAMSLRGAQRRGNLVEAHVLPGA